MSQLQFVLANVLPFIGNGRGLRNVSQDWRQTIDENNQAILDGLYNRYPELETIHDITQALVDDDDVEALRTLAFEYKGYLPITWRYLVNYINSAEIHNLFSHIFTRERDQTGIDTMIKRANMLRDYQDIYPDGYTIDQVYDLAYLNRLWHINRLPSNIRGQVVSNLRYELLDYIINRYSYEDDDEDNNIEFIQRIYTSDLYTYQKILQWLNNNGGLDRKLSKWLNDIEDEINVRTVGPGTSDQQEYSRFLNWTIRDRAVHILDRYAERSNIIPIVVHSFDGDDNKVPQWMYQFLNYKAQEWGVPIDSWIGYIVDNVSTKQLPPPDFWKRILGSAATYANEHMSVGILFNKLMYKYKSQITDKMKEKIRSMGLRI